MQQPLLGSLDESIDDPAAMAASNPPLVRSRSSFISEGSTLSWNNVCFGVKDKEILKGINGRVVPGRLTAIMGPSGAGKSTLLNVLAGRLANTGTMTGSIAINGQEIDPVLFRSRIAYVMQEDALFATQTPREALNFSCALRLAGDHTAQGRHLLVEEMLDKLGLQKCADTYIGSIRIKGISGGEKKRTAIAVELISSPEILFLDEPTSGLDSYAAFNVVTILQQLARGGTTIICTIHQPSSEVFDLFDEALLLADGQLLYQDEVAKIPEYFAEHGHVCKPNYNPADFVMFMMQKQTPAQITSLATHWSKTRQGIDVKVERVSADRAERARRRKAAGACTQLYYLMLREFKNVARDRVSLIARMGTTIFLNLIVGLVFKGACLWPIESITTGGEFDDRAMAQTVQNHFGAIVQIAIGGMFGLSQPTLLSFPLEKPVFMREYATGTYSSWPYSLSKLVVEVPLATIQAGVIFLVTYWLLGISGNFFILTLIVSLTGLTAGSTSLLIGAAVSNVNAAVQLTPLIFVPQLLFAGFFISITEIPVFMRWAQYLCSLKYGINLLLIAEFAELPRDWPASLNESQYYEFILGCEYPVNKKCVNITNDQALLPKSEVEFDRALIYFGILLGVFLFFRIAAGVLLAYKARK